MPARAKRLRVWHGHATCLGSAGEVQSPEARTGVRYSKMRMNAMIVQGSTNQCYLLLLDAGEYYRLFSPFIHVKLCIKPRQNETRVENRVARCFSVMALECKTKKRQCVSKLEKKVAEFFTKLFLENLH